MECNKNEALRSKGITESRFLQHDFSGAKKFALKSRQIFLELVGIDQFISVLDVQIFAHKKLQGDDHNLYGILQIDLRMMILQ